MTRIACVVLACATLCSAALAAASAPSGRIVFSATDAPRNDDVMLVRANGSVLGLSASPALDTAPVVSPDGKRVAFFSTRGGHGAEYVVGTDGKGLRQVSPAIGSALPQVAWSPNGRDLALLTGNALRRASASGDVWVRIDRRDQPQILAGWSPNGTSVAYVDALDNVKVVSPKGMALHTFDGDEARWSPAGRLAVQRNSSTWDVYATTGRRLAAVAAQAVAWSPRDLLASVTAAGVVQVRRGGTGKPLLTVRPVRNGSDPLWAGETHLLIRGENGFVSYDVAHRATFEAAAAYRIDPALARDGSAYGEYPYGSLAHSTLNGSTRALVSAPCEGKDADAFAFLQALPDGSGAVYAGDCSAPHDLFSIAPDGSELARITSTANDEIDPALSPDGLRVAFARVDSADCAGCDHVVWTMNLDGSDARAVPQGNPDILQDDRPSFSPDGSRLVFARWIPSLGDQALLYEAPVAGGAATSLHVSGGNAAWGPSRIAFDGRNGVETMTPGSQVAPVPNTPKLDGGVPAWSPGGTLALLEWEHGFSIVLPATGKRLQLPGLHAPPFVSPGITWSPDGSHLAFTAADRDGVADVWTIGADGTGLTRVTHDLGADGALSWR